MTHAVKLILKHHRQLDVLPRLWNVGTRHSIIDAQSFIASDDKLDNLGGKDSRRTPQQPVVINSANCVNNLKFQQLQNVG